MKMQINPQVLKKIIEDRSRFYPDLEKKFPQINKWIAGEKSPTYNQLVLLSKKIKVPFGYFLLYEYKPYSAGYTIPHFRTVEVKYKFEPSPELLDTFYIIKRRQEWAREYLKELGEGPLEFVGSVTSKNSPEEIAKEIQKVLKLEKDWTRKFKTREEALSYLITKAEEAGIFVVINSIVGNNTHRPLDVDEFRGFVLSDEYAPFIFINGRDAKSAQIFTFAHELTHIWLGKSASFDLRDLKPSADITEKFCNEIAAEFLVPKEKLKKVWEEIKKNKESLNTLLQEFKVSEIVILRRLLDLKLINKKTFYKLYNEYKRNLEKSKENISKASGGNFYSTQVYRIGKRFASLLYSAVKEERILYREAYRLSGLHGKTFDAFYRKKLEIINE